MLTQTESNTSEKCDLQVELFKEPITGELADHILDTVTVDKIYLSRLSQYKVESLVINKSTPLFSFSVPENTNEDENSDSTLEQNILEIDPDFHDENSYIVQSGKNYIAAEDGLFLLVNNKPRIIPVSLDGSSDIRISEDSMSVFVDIYPSIGDNPVTTLEDIVTKLLKLGVVSEVDKSLLSEKLEEMKVDKKQFLNICISRGKPPIDGINGKFENCTNKKEKFEEYKFDEFHRVNPVVSVKEGDIIGIIHPPTKGETGLNVFGQPVNPKPGSEFVIKLGVNTSFDEENDNHIIALKDGFLNLSDNSISITDTFTVNGDVDFESGNIISKGSLKITGNVKNEFTLSLTKNIEVGGYVGDATVEAGENITIHGGFLGKGKGILKANGDVKVKFVENQKVYTRGSLHITKDALNAQLFAKSSIIGNGQCSLIGGHAIAGDIIEVYSLGNDTESETIVEVGFDYLKRNSIVNNKAKQIELRKTLEEVDKNILEFAKMKRLNPQSQEKLRLLADKHKELVTEIDRLKEQNIKLSSAIYVPTDSKISIKGIIYPGVKIGINGRFLQIQHPMKAKTFVLSEDNEVVAV